jgi:hypothetical protein
VILEFLISKDFDDDEEIVWFISKDLEVADEIV